MIIARSSLLAVAGLLLAAPAVAQQPAEPSPAEQPMPPTPAEQAPSSTDRSLPPQEGTQAPTPPDQSADETTTGEKKKRGHGAEGPEADPPK